MKQDNGCVWLCSSYKCELLLETEKTIHHTSKCLIKARGMLIGPIKDTGSDTAAVW